MKVLLVALTIGVLALGMVVARLRSAAAMAEKTPEALPAGVVIVDVRTPAEFAAGHVPQACNIPLDQLADEFPRRVPDKSRPVWLYCRSGRRSGLAEQQLRQLGYTHLRNLGGLDRARQLVGPHVP